jgi:hypothetical protein
VVSLPGPERPRPKNLNAKKTDPSEKEAYAIPEFCLSGPQWVRLLSLLCSVISDDEYSDLEVAKTAALKIDANLQGSDKFKAEVEKLKKYGGPEVKQLIEKLTQPPWDR